MDYLFTPWRFQYVSGGAQSRACLFCHVRGLEDRKGWIVHRGELCFVMLNAFPYTAGHVMIAPYAHLDQFDRLPAESAQEMTALAQRTETVLRRVYKPDGLNLGMNIGAAAGAGVAGHVHLHALPRWIADSNFMTVVGETRVVPESLETTWEKLRGQFS